MKIAANELLEGAPADVLVQALAYDTRSVSPGTAFFCVPGFRVDGHDFAEQAAANGAVLLVVERELDIDLPQVVVESARSAMAVAASRFFGTPSRQLKLVAITGTNGKTTSAFLTRSILEAAGHQTGLIGTVKTVVGGAENHLPRTTPEAIDLQQLMRAMVDSGDTAAVLEASSHAMTLHRFDGTECDVVAFTNISRDHLDFHRDIESYFQAKRKLFELESKAQVVNIDDEYGRRLAEDFPRALTFSTKREADYTATDIEFLGQQTEFTLNLRGQLVRVQIPLTGHFNVENALVAAAAGDQLGASAEQIKVGLMNTEQVPGRMEFVDAGQQFKVIVDFAHNPDGLEALLSHAQEITSGDVIAVVGAVGERDRGKRPVMGEIASRLSDHLIITTDDSFSEDPMVVIEDLLTGTGPGTERVNDRREAFARAIALAQPDDIVVIAGRGHEPVLMVQDTHTPFLDADVAREELEKRLVADRAGKQ